MAHTTWIATHSRSDTTLYELGITMLDALLIADKEIITASGLRTKVGSKSERRHALALDRLSLLLSGECTHKLKLHTTTADLPL